MPDIRIAPVETPNGHGPADTVHWWCCNPDIGICGTDLTSTPEAPDDTEVTCVVCIEIVNQPCRLCGSTA